MRSEDGVPFAKRWARSAQLSLRRLGTIGTRSLGVAVPVCLLGGFMASGVPGLQSHAQANQASAAGWGSEALAVLEETASALSPISIANACGLGTSSCARCHDGKRAAAPPATSTTGPWHRDHARVPYSCVGCHEGNARVLRQDVAHKKLVNLPLSEPARHCATCHKSAEIAALAKRYQPTATP